MSHCARRRASRKSFSPDDPALVSEEPVPTELAATRPLLAVGGAGHRCGHGAPDAGRSRACSRRRGALFVSAVAGATRPDGHRLGSCAS